MSDRTSQIVGTQAQNCVENKITVTPFVLKWLVTNE